MVIITNRPSPYPFVCFGLQVSAYSEKTHAKPWDPLYTTHMSPQKKRPHEIFEATHRVDDPYDDICRMTEHEAFEYLIRYKLAVTPDKCTRCKCAVRRLVSKDRGVCYRCDNYRCSRPRLPLTKFVTALYERTENMNMRV